MSIRKGNDIIASKPLIDAVPTQDSTNAVSSGGVYTALQGKQDTISDLATIRSGAAAGATAVQPATLDSYVTLATAQTISGVKTFSSELHSTNNITFDSAQATPIIRGMSGANYRNMIVRTNSSSSIDVGNPNDTINLKGSATNPTYNGNNLALYSDLPTVNNPTITLTQGGVTKGSFTLNQASGDTIDFDAGGGYHPDLFDFKWADHEVNDVQWLRADTFSWQSGSVYEAGYQHLADDIDGKTLQSETIGGTTIQFYLADDGHKICPASEESNVVAIYTATGVAWYYIIDTVNERFKLPRVDADREILLSSASVSLAATGTLQIRNASNGVENVLKSPSGDQNGRRMLVVDASSTGQSNVVQYAGGVAGTADIAGASGDFKGKKYLYFYVGEFTQTALENTAGITAAQLNAKADTDFGNTSMIDYVVAKQEPNAGNNYTWYRKYKSGWVEQGGRTSVASTATNNAYTLSISLPVEMADNMYTGLCQATFSGGSSWNGPVITGASTTTQAVFGGWVSGTSTVTAQAWQVSGMAA